VLLSNKSLQQEMSPLLHLFGQDLGKFGVLRFSGVTKGLWGAIEQGSMHVLIS
jgi:hypothetical protein